MAMMEDIIYKVLLNLRKAYCDLDRERFLDILVGYGIVPRTERILWIY